jgi:hypothetical protein
MAVSCFAQVTKHEETEGKACTVQELASSVAQKVHYMENVACHVSQQAQEWASKLANKARAPASSGSVARSA